MNAFGTRFGLFEWLATPFGLANVPSTFKQWVNRALRDFLDDFGPSRSIYRKHVRKVLQRLKDAGLQLYIDKCTFKVKSTEYLAPSRERYSHEAKAIVD
jgi:hypothetical protein